MQLSSRIRLIKFCTTTRKAWLRRWVTFRTIAASRSRSRLSIAVCRRRRPGVYSTTVKLPASGHYDVAFLTDSPRIAHCFETTADTNPLLKEDRPVALRIEHAAKGRELPVGQNFPLRFKLIETKTNKAKTI